MTKQTATHFEDIDPVESREWQEAIEDVMRGSRALPAGPRCSTSTRCGGHSTVFGDNPISKHHSSR